MNQAMKLYDKHFHGNSSDNRINEFKAILLKRNDYTLKLLPTNEEQFTFPDNSKLIFTWDNVQVTLF